MASVMQSVFGGGTTEVTVEVPATSPIVIHELDFTTDMTTIDISAFSVHSGGGVTHSIKKADGTTEKTAVIHSFTTGTEMDLDVIATSGTGIEVAMRQNAAANENHILAFPIPTADLKLDTDLIMVEVLLADVTFDRNYDQMICNISDGTYWGETPSYGWELRRINATTYEHKSRRDKSGGGGTVKSSAHSVTVSGGEDYCVQILLSRDEALIYVDGSSTYQTPRAPSTFTGSSGTFGIGAVQPYAPRWTSPHVVFSGLKDAGTESVYTIKKIRVSRWSPGSS